MLHITVLQNRLKPSILSKINTLCYDVCYVLYATNKRPGHLSIIQYTKLVLPWSQYLCLENHEIYNFEQGYQHILDNLAVLKKIIFINLQLHTLYRV
jgi:hypothetical protein